MKTVKQKLGLMVRAWDAEVDIREQNPPHSPVQVCFGRQESELWHEK